MGSKRRTPAPPELMTKAECAAYLRVHETALDRYTTREDDALPFFKLAEGGSGAVRFRRTEVDEWLERRASRVAG